MTITPTGSQERQTVPVKNIARGVWDMAVASEYDFFESARHGGNHYVPHRK